jgi:hypothetical protein
MKRTLTVLVVLALPLLTAVVVGAASEPPTEVTIDAAVNKQGPVAFPHATHMEVVESCTVCHHTQEGMTADNVGDVTACTECHLDPQDEAPSMGEMSLKKNPFHSLCINCHKEQEKGPTKCFDCHAKK